MNSDPSGFDFAREQFRMSRLQVFNWGTFSGIHDIPISDRGFLFVGRSGAGKSTLLDAFSALLVPPRWLDFNAAAREADRTGRDRNLASYVRGAWAEQKDDESGEIATRYLRNGTTWSALALSYANGLGQKVALVQIFWLRGNTNGNTDVRRQHLIFERPFDLRELEEFGSHLEVRRLKQQFPDAFVRDEFRPYCERFCRLLGIENEMALRLLHKTQSAKNLGDLNTFLRDFMLDKPETFAVADRLVNEFGELNAAHQAVVTARQQIETLAPAREQYQCRESLLAERLGLEELQLGLNSYRESLRKKLLGEQIEKLHIQKEGLDGEMLRLESALENRSAELRDLEQQHREAGGDQIEQWEAEKKNLEIQRGERLRKLSQAEAACQELGWLLPDSPKGFSELVGRARREMEEWQTDDSQQEQLFRLNQEKTETEKACKEVGREVLALRRQPSNIPAHMLELRREIAIAIGVAETALPFVGELLQVKAEEAPWNGALERVLHGFSLSLLVDERHYTSLASHINRVNLGRRLVYYRTGAIEEQQAKPVSPNSLVLKLSVKPGAWSPWLLAELRRRFDYACVDSLQAFRSAERALTREGQVKHNKSRHEKDDRHSVDNRRDWVLGFDNREKLAIFERLHRESQDKAEKLDKEIRALMERQKSRGIRAIHCQTLVNLQWQEIDAVPLIERIETIVKQLRQTREGNSRLHQLGGRIERQQVLITRAENELTEVKAEVKNLAKQATEANERLIALQQDPVIVPLTPHQKKGLDERYAKLSQTVQLDKLDHYDRSVAKALAAEMDQLEEAIRGCEKVVEKCFGDFIRAWSAESGGLDATLAAAPDFFAKLTRLEIDGLQNYEERFFELLQNQSNQNLAALATHLNNARKEILEKMDLVNDSLSQAPFNQSVDQKTYLHIYAADRLLPDVVEFKQQVKQALSHAWSKDRDLAELRFVTLRQLVDRLASQAPEQRRWRESVLDVRLHVEFIGREIDEEGVEVEVYRSGAGKSGGQRQKLATTCLAAALRYQLGGNDHRVPMYAPVVLDEAFDKADNEFTALAMNIFANFGFQMIVATPLKSVMTLEPFIGGACFVDISDRRVSGILLIEYDLERQRLILPEQSGAGGPDETEAT